VRLHNRKLSYKKSDRSTLLPVADFTVGNTITIAVAIYRNNLKKFLKLSLVAHLWLLLPIYGWARYFAIAAWISRLSLNELQDKPDPIQRERYFTISSLFIFLFTALITIFITVIAGYLLVICMLYAGALFLQMLLKSTIYNDLNNIMEQQEGTNFWLVFWLIIILFSLISTFLYIRLSFTDLVFISQQSNNPFSLIKHSYLITKDKKLKVFFILWISFVSYCYLYASTFILYYLVSFIFDRIGLYQLDSIYYGILYGYRMMLIFITILAFPLWQSIKAASFYYLDRQNNNFNLR